MPVAFRDGPRLEYPSKFLNPGANCGSWVSAARAEVDGEFVDLGGSLGIDDCGTVSLNDLAGRGNFDFGAGGGDVETDIDASDFTGTEMTPWT